MKPGERLTPNKVSSNKLCRQWYPVGRAKMKIDTYEKRVKGSERHTRRREEGREEGREGGREGGKEISKGVDGDHCVVPERALCRARKTNQTLLAGFRSTQ